MRISVGVLICSQCLATGFPFLFSLIVLLARAVHHLVFHAAATYEQVPFGIEAKRVYGGRRRGFADRDHRTLLVRGLPLRILLQPLPHLAFFFLVGLLRLLHRLLHRLLGLLLGLLLRVRFGGVGLVFLFSVIRRLLIFVRCAAGVSSSCSVSVPVPVLVTVAASLSDFFSSAAGDKAANKANARMLEMGSTNPSQSFW